MAAMLLALACSNLNAQSTSLDQEISQAIKAPNAVARIGTDLFGDKVNLFTGSLEFVQTDVSLPGNNRLPVSVGRRIVTGTTKARGRPFGSWDLDIPHLHGVFGKEDGWTNDARLANRCSNFSAPEAHHNGAIWVGQEFWQGNYMYVPGIGDQQMLLRDNANTKAPGPVSNYPVVTKDYWNFSCLAKLNNDSTGGTRGEGFLATAPDGTSYRFDQMVSYDYLGITKKLGHAVRKDDAPDPEPGPQVGDTADPSVAKETTSLLRVEVWILPTEVTDRFGNWVRYSYDPAYPRNLTSITSSDGRAISITYGDPTDRALITAVTDGTRTWNYTYTSYEFSGAAYFALDTVLLPDASTWQLSGIDPLIYKLGVGFGTDSCNTQFFPSGTPVGSMVHPTGATGTFTLQGMVHGRSDVPYSCSLTPSGGQYNPRARYFYTLSLVEKSISGPGLEAMAWRYAYGPPNASWAPCEAPCPTSKSVSVTDPHGDVTRHTYGNRFRVSEGRIEQVDYGWDGARALKTVKTRYRAPGAGPYPATAGQGGESITDGEALARFMPVDQVETTQQGIVFTWTANAFDDMARVADLTRSSTLGMSNSETTAYEDKFPIWVLGLVKSINVPLANGNLVENSYRPNGNLHTVKKFGVLQQTLTYAADGSLQTLADGKGQTTRYANFKAGMPQNISYPDGSSESALVNSIGYILSTTDAAGFTTTYGHDAMGRVNLITPPAPGGVVTWNPTSIAFSQIHTPEYDLPSAHWRQEVSTGNARTRTYYDALWRPVYTEKWDATDVAGTMSVVRRNHDADGRVTYESYPKRSAWEISEGTYHEYDALGRPTVTSAISELGILYYGNAYLDGFIKNYTDARGNTSLTSYQVFDQPSEDAIISIAAPEGVSVSIPRDILGKPLSITRSGNGKSATRAYVYEWNSQRLCKTIEPETGSTLQDYDLAGNVIWRASGLALPDVNACEWASVPAAKKISYTYDSLNRPLVTSFGDGSPSILRSYTADGLPLTVDSNGANWTYGYNSLRLNHSASLAYGGTTYNLTRAFDSNGAVSQLTYPDGTALAYNPNALGNPRQVGAFASAVTYYPNGAIQGFTYGNGITHTLAQNMRGLPAQSTDAGVIDDQYTYDQNANVAGIADLLATGVSSRTMNYDNLDRLATVSAPGLRGSASYTYDALDNLTATTITGGDTARSTSHTINPATNRIDSISGGPAGYNFTYAYDSQGNIIQRGAQAYVFDIGNRMRSASGKATYGYDGLGRRFTVVGADGVNRVQLYSQAGQLLYVGSTSAPLAAGTKYIYLNRHQIAEITDAGKASNVATYIHTDGLGSPVVRTDSAGNLVSRTRYEPYGLTAAGATPTIGFTGHVNDADTGLVYMQQRYYDPVAGRMLSIDPVTTDANTGISFNRYAYANNSPYKYIDPDGRLPILIPFAIFVAKELAGEAFEQFTGLPAPTVKNAGKSALKLIVKSTKELRGGGFKKAKEQVIKDANGVCEYCQKNAATQGDHAETLNTVKQKVNAGDISKVDAKVAANSKDNIVASCKGCNEVDKHTKDLGNGAGQYNPPYPTERVKEMMEK